MYMQRLFVTTVLVCGFISNMLAQPNPAVAVEKMKAFSALSGNWKGEGIYKSPQGSSKSNVTEKISFKLDNTALMLEGMGVVSRPGKPDSVVHNALGLIHYDQINSKYTFRSYLADGRSTDAWINVTGVNQFQWGFDVPQGKIRYTIKIDLDKKTWYEFGEFSRDGNQYFQFFEMTLVKSN